MNKKRPPRPAPPPKNNIVYLKRGDTVYKMDESRPRFTISKLMVITVLLIFVGALSALATAAHMANTRRELVQVQQALAAQLDANSMLASQITQPYTLAEIEELASERLGMARPDPSQIIYIYVPPISHVVFNPDAQILPPQRSFWEELGAFVRVIINRVFGG